MRTRRLVFGVLVAALVVLSQTSLHAATTYVSPGGLQNAIDAASPRDSLVLYGGHYAEAIVVDKPLTFRHVPSDLYDPVIIDAGCSSPVAFDIQSSDVSVLGSLKFDRTFVVNNGMLTDIRIQDVSHVKLVAMSAASDQFGACAGGVGIEIANSTRVSLKKSGAGFCGAGSPDVGVYLHDINVSNAGIRLDQVGVCPDTTGTGFLFQNIAPGARLGKAGVTLTDSFGGAPGAYVGPGVYGARLVQASGLVVTKSLFDGSTNSVLVDANSNNSTFRGNEFVTDVVDDGQGNCWTNNKGAGTFPTTCP